MKDRIKKIRKTFDLTQQKFADRIGVKQNTIAQYEMGRNIPIDSVVSLICREFDVSEEWLRHGKGDMFLPKNREDEIARMVKSLLSDETDTFKSRFISMLAELSVSDWERLEMEARKLLGDNTEQKLTTANPISSETSATSEPLKNSSDELSDKEINFTDMSIDEQVELYRKELEKEKRAKEELEVLQKSG